MYERSVSAPRDNASDRTEPDECLAAESLDSTDPAAGERLLDRYSWLVQTVIRRYHLSPEDEADVYQDVFLNCWRELPTLRDRARLGYSIDSIGAIRGRCLRTLRSILHQLGSK